MARQRGIDIFQIAKQLPVVRSLDTDDDNVPLVQVLRDTRDVCGLHKFFFRIYVFVAKHISPSEQVNKRLCFLICRPSFIHENISYVVK